MARSPPASATATTSSAIIGSTSALGCHTSNSSSLPMAHCSPTTAAATASIARTPPTRRATATASVAAAMLTSITPTASPTHGPSSLTGSARASK